jgi:hypothetical protein
MSYLFIDIVALSMGMSVSLLKMVVLFLLTCN